MSLTRAYARTLCSTAADMGLNVGDPRLDARIDEAMGRLIRHFNAFVQAEEYDQAPIVFVANSDPLQIDNSPALKKQVLALWREQNNLLNDATALETAANAQLDQDTASAFDAANKVLYKGFIASAAPYSSNWYLGHVGLALAAVGGLRTSAVKTARYVTRATLWLFQKVYEYSLIERNRVLNGVPPLNIQPTDPTVAYPYPLDLDTLKLTCQALMLQDSAIPSQALGASNQPAQLAQTYLTEATAMLTRRLDAELEALRHTTYTATLETLPSNTFGFFCAELALDLPNGLKLSAIEMRRLINSAERRLMECGKWKNQIRDFEVQVADNGETDMPPEIEVVLGAIVNNQSALMKGRFYEVVEGGPGRVTVDRRALSNLLVDRGEVMDGYRRYFVSLPCQHRDYPNGALAVLPDLCPIVNQDAINDHDVYKAQCGHCCRHCGGDHSITVRAKRRFIQKVADTDPMQVNNLNAVQRAVESLIHEGFVMGILERDPKLAAIKWAMAKGILMDEQTETTGPNLGAIPVQTDPYGSWGGPVESVM